jgi:hypothetical protein
MIEAQAFMVAAREGLRDRILANLAVALRPVEVVQHPVEHVFFLAE